MSHTQQGTMDLQGRVGDEFQACVTLGAHARRNAMNEMNMHLAYALVSLPS